MRNFKWIAFQPGDLWPDFSLVIAIKAAWSRTEDAIIDIEKAEVQTPEGEMPLLALGEPRAFRAENWWIDGEDFITAYAYEEDTNADA